MTMTLTTRRLHLRPLEYTDARHFARLFGHDRDAIAMTATLPDLLNEEEAAKWIARRLRDSKGFAICQAGDGLFIGAIGYGAVLDRIELGYGMGRPFWGHGYATEAVREVVRFARTDGISMIEACTFPSNPASARVLEKNGFKNLGRISRNYPQRGGQQAVFHHVLDLTKNPDRLG